MHHTLPRHQCMIYEGLPSRHLQGLALTLISKLKSNKRCLYLNSPMMVDEMSLMLISLGVNISMETKKGSLILASDQDHLVDGAFDVEKMLDMLDTTLQSALSDGYAGLWATGDMTWELGSEKDMAKLFDYERRLETYMERNPELSGICQYHRDTIPFRAIKIALHAHPAIYINDTLSRLNPDYHPVAAI